MMHRRGVVYARPVCAVPNLGDTNRYVNTGLELFWSSLGHSSGSAPERLTDAVLPTDQFHEPNIPQPP
jgi:hypothetical protein